MVGYQVLAAVFWISVGLIIYVYAGYPLILSFISVFFPSRTFSKEYIPSVTLLIAAYNEEDVIAEKIENSFSLGYPRDKLQILVAADGSDDQTVEIVRQFEDKEVLLSYVPERGGKMAAINRAMQVATGEIVVFSDANNMYAKDAIRVLVAPFSDARVGTTTGAKMILEDDRGISQSEGLYWKYEAFIKKQETRLGTCTSSVGEMTAIRRNLYQAPPSNIINDDFYLIADIIRRGYQNIYVPDAKSFEKVSATAQDEVIRRTRIITGRYQAIAMAHTLLPWKRPLVVWQMVSHKFMRPLVPFFMLGALLSNILLIIWRPLPGLLPLIRLANPYNYVFMILQTAFYCMAIMGNLLPSRGVLAKLFYIPTFLVNSNYAAVAGLYKYVFGKQSHLWQRVKRS
jgi:cellulose synthase/poly-beta-1,6-N-acetylglucosamine synthase-like glycosyltransferase